MRRHSRAGRTAGLLAVAGLLAATSVSQAQQRGGSPAVSSLAPMDYIMIQQLVAKFAYALDSGADKGYAYADLFASDGVFIQGEANGRARVTGRDQLAALARVGPNDRRGPLTLNHFIVNHVIEPAAGGATGKEYMVHLIFDDNGNNGKIHLGGHYQDSYVKTPGGWRFKSRQFIESKSGPQPALAPAPR